MGLESNLRQSTNEIEEHIQQHKFRNFNNRCTCWHY
jgi:hypothetical protein